MTIIHNNLHQFTEYLEMADFSAHQYLLLTEEPILIHTGTARNAETIIPQIKQLLGERPLKYIFVSHFESDECGGLSALAKEFPEAATVCSEVTSRQLFGFGITYNVIVKKPGEKLSGNDFDFSFISYPSEMHLWEGLLFFENKQEIFFSSDLMFSMGKIHDEVIEKDWESAVAGSGIDWIPDAQSREKLVNDLKQISPQFIATGHGPCIKLLSTSPSLR